MSTVTVVRVEITSDSTVIDGQVVTKRGYSQGWRNAEQDHKPPPRVAKIISQDYNVIKRECLEQEALWEDPSFPAADHSIYPSSQGPLPFKWMRASVSVFYVAMLQAVC